MVRRPQAEGRESWAPALLLLWFSWDLGQSIQPWFPHLQQKGVEFGDLSAPFQLWISVIPFQVLRAAAKPCGCTASLPFQPVCFLLPPEPFLFNELWLTVPCLFPWSPRPASRSLDYFFLPREHVFVTNLLLLFYPTPLHCRLWGLF